MLSLVSLASTSGRIHWSYGEPALDEKAASTCCTRKGRLVAPFRALPAPAVRDMVEEDWRLICTLCMLDQSLSRSAMYLIFNIF